jgi:N-glycosidase YbiA
MTTWTDWQQRRYRNALTACQGHRQTYHLSTDDVPNIDCQMECLAWTTCPLSQAQHAVIDRFFGDYIFLSNFYYADMMVAGVRYPSVEHAYQAKKTYSIRWQERIRRAPTPKVAKRLGYQVPLREDWEDVKLDVMRTLVRWKFNPDWHPDLTAKLLATGDALLVEGNTWGDRFWGVERATGLGLNHLGRILMDVRDEVRT